MAPQDPPAGYKYLGQGYNVATGNYADVSSLLASVLDLTRLGQLVTETAAPSSTKVTIAGSTAATYRQRLSAHAKLEGAYGGFSGSVEASFAQTDETRLDTAFCSIWAPQILYRLDLAHDSVGLARFVSEDFAADCKREVDPFKFFAKWGTHYVHGALIGGRYMYGLTTQTTEKFSTTDFSATVDASYDAFASAQGGLTITSKETHKSFDCDIKLSTYGGKSNPANFAAWSDSVAANPTLMDFPAGGLLPIHELCPDAKYAEALQRALPLYLHPPLQLATFSATGAAASHPTVSLTVPDGFKILGGGAHVEGKQEEVGVFLTASYPVSGHEWHAAAKDHADVVRSAPLTAYVVAVYDPRDALDVKITEATGELDGAPVATTAVTAEYVMTGGGAIVVYPPGSVGSMLTASFPSKGSEWSAAAKAHIYPCPARTTAYAIGVKVRDPSVYPFVAVPSALQTTLQHAQNAEASRFPDATVEADGPLVGGGAQDHWEAPGNLLLSSYPTGRSWRAQGADNHNVGVGRMESYAIGLRGLPASTRS